MVTTRIQVRRGSTSDWNTSNPVLSTGEIGFNTTLGAIKIGDGTSTWSLLDYLPTMADLTPAEVGAIALSEKGAANGVAELDGNKDVITASKIVFEGATADAYEAYIQLGAEPAVADITLTLPTTSGTFVTANTSGDVTISGNLTVSGTTTTIDTTNLQVEDKNIILGYGSTSDAAVDGGGITLTGATNHTFNWVDATDAWTSSEHMNLASGKSYYMNGTLLKDVSETLTNKTISGGTLTGTLTAGGGVGSSGQYLESTGTGVRWTTVSGYSAPTIGSTLIASGSTVTTIAGLTLTTPAINNILYGYTTTVTAAGTTTLTASSNYKQYFTGTTTQTVVLPVASTMTLGQTFYIENNSTGNLTVNSSGSNLVVTVIPGSVVLITCILTSGTTAASWDVDWDGFTSITGTGSLVLSTSPTFTTAITLNGTAELRFADTDSSNYVGFKSPGTVTTNKIWTLPSADGTSGQVLSTNGSATLSWTTPAAGAAFSEFMLIGA